MEEFFKNLSLENGKKGRIFERCELKEWLKKEEFFEKSEQKEW